MRPLRPDQRSNGLLKNAPGSSSSPSAFLEKKKVQ
jgi:hypothetical protein